MTEAEHALGGIDMLVHATDILTQAPLVEMSLAQWQQMIDVNLTGVFLTCRHVVPGMVGRGAGRVNNIASQWRARAGVLMHYSAAQAGVIGLTKAPWRWPATGSGSMPSLPARSRRRWSPGSRRIGGQPSARSCRSTASAARGVTPTPVSGQFTRRDLHVGQKLGSNSGDVMP
jgi:3-oxoacyl-[acyl-carrier protein] reductase